MNISMTGVRIELSKGERKFIKIIAGTNVKKTKVNLPETVMLCSVSQLLHLNGLDDLTIIL